MTLHHCGMLSQKHVSKSFHIFNIQDGTEVRKLQMPDENFNIKKIFFGIVMLCIWLNLDKIIYFLKWGDVIDRSWQKWGTSDQNKLEESNIP